MRRPHVGVSCAGEAGSGPATLFLESIRRDICGHG